MSSQAQTITELNTAIEERLYLCNDQVEEYKQAEIVYGEPVDRRKGWQRLANEAVTALSLFKQYKTNDPIPNIPAKVAAELRQQFGDIDLARHIECNDLRAIDCNPY
ncbi:hypothetical protein IQ266_03340 [filamentous cyanobacterium LEGE 11480]|uniref:Uncharacterized protein n=1 Tax=Romeriopsis navalis LEGE 11480 TaxID=2777977 RepID=A0A928VJC4_9CYAN|nr:hypothetical protein [Romeriopsis navalis]MBE9028793.1 hypothetical protein [Romeriopsis navalis LEGE 11480]